ncbi:MAG: N-acetylmuramoyl-L-alanine amidase [Chloroflexi bacterium]|nr:N-acetylmuramoyl-L-alanine amidase [Chloroflexota bacterium]
MESIEADNNYHRQKDWGEGSRAPHIAYTLWLPYEPMAFLVAYGIACDEQNPPKGVAVLCNYLWERTWHGTNANDSCLGVTCQVDGESQELSESQKLAVTWLLNEWLPGQGVNIPKGNVWGHGETPNVYGGGPDFGNNTVCPGKYVLPWVKSLRS